MLLIAIVQAMTQYSERIISCRGFETPKARSPTGPLNSFRPWMRGRSRLSHKICLCHNRSAMNALESINVLLFAQAHPEQLALPPRYSQLHRWCGIITNGRSKTDLVQHAVPRLLRHRHQRQSELPLLERQQLGQSGSSLDGELHPLRVIVTDGIVTQICQTGDHVVSAPAALPSHVH